MNQKIKADKRVGLCDFTEKSEENLMRVFPSKKLPRERLS